MKRSNLLYWISTFLFAAFMIFSSIPGINPEGQTLEVLHDAMGYPVYFIQFISVAKIAGAIVLLIPQLNKLKEWAYAGLFFDLAGALYSVYMMQHKLDKGMLFILLPVLLGAASYYLWNKTKAVEK